MSKKVLVLMGGFSAEREVSLVSGQGVADALKSKGYEVICHDLRDVRAFIRVLEQEHPDVVFNALHGNWGEDGEIQGLLDLLQIPYTHSGVKASAMGMDKAVTKIMAQSCGIKTAASEEMTYGEFKRRGTFMKLPFVVKPECDGSSVGVFIVKMAEDVEKVRYDDDDTALIVEQYVPGKELTCAVLDSKALAVTELRAKTAFYDYEAKYTDGMTQHILPAPLADEVTATCKDYAERLHKKLGCRSVSRCDFRYNEQDGVVLLEINTAPGLTPLSLVPEQAAYCGIDYPSLCEKLVNGAVCRKIG